MILSKPPLPLSLISHLQGGQGQWEIANPQGIPSPGSRILGFNPAGLWRAELRFPVRKLRSPVTCQTGNAELLQAGLSSHLPTLQAVGQAPHGYLPTPLKAGEQSPGPWHQQRGQSTRGPGHGLSDSNSLLGSKTACPRQARPGLLLVQGGQAASQGAGGLANGALELGHSPQGQSQRVQRP